MPEVFYLVDAFVTDRPFSGNPAGVVLLAEPVSEEWMQKVAAEMNQAETAFLWPLDEYRFSLRWFTPTVEVDLCGHATLASAQILTVSGIEGPYRFQTKSGELTAKVMDDSIELDFPLDPVGQTANFTLSQMFPHAVFQGAGKFDWFVEVPSEDDVRDFRPDMKAIEALGRRGLIVSALGTTFDVVSRFFAPQSGVPEDHVTGSAHCAIADYYGAKLGRTNLKAFQASPRTGFLALTVQGDRVMLEGLARVMVAGTLYA